MKLNKKIWVKKTSASNSRRQYVQIYLRDFLSIKKAYKSVPNGKKMLIPYKRAPIGYSSYRYFKVNYIRGLIWLSVVVVLILGFILLKNNAVLIKHEIAKLTR